MAKDPKNMTLDELGVPAIPDDFAAASTEPRYKDIGYSLKGLRPSLPALEESDDWPYEPYRDPFAERPPINWKRAFQRAAARAAICTMATIMPASDAIGTNMAVHPAKATLTHSHSLK